VSVSQAFALVVALGLILAALALAHHERHRRPRLALMRLYVISERGAGDATVEGLFLGFEADHYRLANARHVQSGDDPIALDGEAWIPRARVLYAQKLG